MGPPRRFFGGVAPPGPFFSKLIIFFVVNNLKFFTSRRSLIFYLPQPPCHTTSYEPILDEYSLDPADSFSSQVSAPRWILESPSCLSGRDPNHQVLPLYYSSLIKFFRLALRFASISSTVFFCSRLRLPDTSSWRIVRRLSDRKEPSSASTSISGFAFSPRPRSSSRFSQNYWLTGIFLSVHFVP